MRKRSVFLLAKLGRKPSLDENCCNPESALKTQSKTSVWARTGDYSKTEAIDDLLRKITESLQRRIPFSTSEKSKNLKKINSIVYTTSKLKKTPENPFLESVSGDRGAKLAVGSSFILPFFQAPSPSDAPLLANKVYDVTESFRWNRLHGVKKPNPKPVTTINSLCPAYSVSFKLQVSPGGSTSAKNLLLFRVENQCLRLNLSQPWYILLKSSSH